MEILGQRRHGWAYLCGRQTRQEPALWIPSTPHQHLTHIPPRRVRAQRIGEHRPPNLPQLRRALQGFNAYCFQALGHTRKLYSSLVSRPAFGRARPRSGSWASFRPQAIFLPPPEGGAEAGPRIGRPVHLGPILWPGRPSAESAPSPFGMKGFSKIPGPRPCGAGQRPASVMAPAAPLKVLDGAQLIVYRHSGHQRRIGPQGRCAEIHRDMAAFAGLQVGDLIALPLQGLQGLQLAGARRRLMIDSPLPCPAPAPGW